MLTKFQTLIATYILEMGGKPSSRNLASVIGLSKSTINNLLNGQKAGVKTQKKIDELIQNLSASRKRKYREIENLNNILTSKASNALKNAIKAGDPLPLKSLLAGAKKTTSANSQKVKIGSKYYFPLKAVRDYSDPES